VVSWTAPAVTRTDEPFTGPERGILDGFLDRHNGHADLLRQRVDGVTGS
jgi:hypothetical protein